MTSHYHRAQVYRLNALLSCIGLVVLASCRADGERVLKDERTSTYPRSSASNPAARESSTLAPSKLQKLSFEDTVTGPRLLGIEACVQGMAGKDWQAVPWQEIGNFFEAKWCRGKGARSDCQIAESSARNRDQHAIALSTLHDDAGPYFGLGLNALWVPAATGWGASFYFSENGKSIVGEGFALEFRHFASVTAAPAEEIFLGQGYRYSIFEEGYTLGTSKLPLRVDLARYLGSAEGLRDAALELVTKARAEATGIISAHKATVRVYTPSSRPGLPPRHTKRPPTAAEETLELAKLKTHFDAKEALLRGSYVAMAEALIQAFPVDRCWK